MAAINLAATDIVCDANLQGNNVVCETDIIDYHTYLVQFINRFINSVFPHIVLFDSDVDHQEILDTKKQIFKLCSTGEMYPEFIQYMFNTASVVVVVGGVGVPPVFLSIFDVGMLGAPMLLTSVGPVEIKIVNLFVMGVSMHLIGLKSWGEDFNLKSRLGPQLIDVITPEFTIGPHIVHAYAMKSAQLRGLEGQLSRVPDAPAVRAVVHAASRGMKHVGTPIQELLLRASNYFALGGGTGDIRIDLSGVYGSTLTYTANTLMQDPPKPSVSHLANGTMIWNNSRQLGSTKLYVSIFEGDGHDVATTLLPIHQTGRIMELYIFDTRNRNNCQHWFVDAVTGSAENYVEYYVKIDPIKSNGWVAANGEECEVVVLREGQNVPPPSRRFSSKFHKFMGGGAKKQNKSKRRKQKRSNKKKSRHYNRNNRKRFY
jgi:hypothetical protein